MKIYFGSTRLGRSFGTVENFSAGNFGFTIWGFNCGENKQLTF